MHFPTRVSPRSTQNRCIRRLFASAYMLALSSLVTTQAADFTIRSGEEVTTLQNLSSNESGIIEEGGKLTTPGRGIEGDGANITISNAGIISSADEGIYVGPVGGDTGLVITNSGTITTTGFRSYGIWSGTRTGSMITNSGIISTNGDNGYGIYSTGTGGLIVNQGLVTTSGSNSFGIYGFATGSTIINSGTIFTSGVNARAIIIAADDMVVTNSGQIITTGDAGTGVDGYRANQTFINTGTIMTSGGAVGTLRASAVRLYGQNAMIINSGVISATGPGVYAIESLDVPNNDITLTLLPGSQIFGPIDLGSNADNDIVNVYSSGLSDSLTLQNVEQINLFGPGVVSGNRVITLDPTFESTRSVALAGFTSSIHRLVTQRMTHTTPLKPVQIASLSLSPGMYFEERKPVAWSQVFGGHLDRQAEGGAQGYDYGHIGVNFGYEWDMGRQRTGLLGGIVNNTFNTQTDSLYTESEQFYLGAYANRKLQGFNLTGSLLAGYGIYDNQRLVLDNVNGLETASSEFDSFFISPGFTIGSAYDVIDSVELRPSVSVNYSIAWLESYGESGTTNSNLQFDERTVSAITARAQLAAAYQFDPSNEFELRLGINARDTDDEDIRISIANSQSSFASAGEQTVVGGFAGVNIRTATEDNLSLVADIEFGGNADESYLAGFLRLEYLF